MKRCLYSNFIAITNYRNKNAFLVYYDDIKEAHQKYADAINVDYVLFEGTTNNYNLPLYEQINLAKYINGEALLQEYDEIFYIDFDIIPNTSINCFRRWDLQSHIPIKATIDFDCYPSAQQYIDHINQVKFNTELEEYNTISRQFNEEQDKILKRYDKLTQQYWRGISDDSYHGRPWSEETRPKQFEEELGLDWWYKKHDFDINLVNRPMKTFKENFIEINTPSPDTIQPWDDIVKYAAADVLTTTPILYNTGVMGFSRNTFKDLNIINRIEEFKNKIKRFIKSEKWPEFITRHIDFNNEVLFSYCADKVNIKHIPDSWNYFVDWDSGVIEVEQSSSFEDCKFRHYLNKNFEKQWPT